VNELVKILNGFSRQGRTGTQIYVGKYGSIISSPEGVDLSKHPKLKDSEDSAKAKKVVAQIIRSIGIESIIVKKIICPFCSSMCSTKLKFCGVCGEPLPNS